MELTSCVSTKIAIKQRKAITNDTIIKNAFNDRKTCRIL